jgi:hypothetical protein
MSIGSLEKHPLVRYLRDPASATSFHVRDWERLIRAARHGSLLSRVAWLAKDKGLIHQFPDRVRFHLESALRVSESQATSVGFEVAQIQRALAQSGIPFVLLKGAAYIQGGFASAHGRLMSDIDMMVAKNDLAGAEKALCEHGWFPTKLDPYDQRYYREWMHEIPPMQHLGRGTVLDVHHTILPPTALLKPDVDKLWRAVGAVGSAKGVFVLSPVDMVLHSATHLFHDGELEHGLRDLVDMDALMGQFSVQDGFFEALIARAGDLDLERPLFYALKYCKAFLLTSIPPDICKDVTAYGNRSGIVRAVMDVVVLESLGAVLEDRPSIRLPISQLAMYVRSHYLRMPLHQLVPHLIRKQFREESD